jgi:hypothetical protein
MTLCDTIIGGGKVGAKEKSVIDKCVTRVYAKHAVGGFKRVCSHEVGSSSASFREELSQKRWLAECPQINPEYEKQAILRDPAIGLPPDFCNRA